jgi:hypothetical protein
MQIADPRLLGPRFERRLKAALDSVVPRTPHFSEARYRSASWARSHRPWRLAPAFVGLAAIGITALSAAAATSSPNPAVWTQRAVSTIQSVSHIPDNNPIPPQNSAPDPRGAAPVSQQPVKSHATPPSDRPAQPSARPEGSPRPDGQPERDHYQPPSPSPTPPGYGGHDWGPSPPPDDHGGGGHDH